MSENTNAVNEETALYRLGDTARIERLTEIQARIRNRNRNACGGTVKLWQIVTEAEAEALALQNPEPPETAQQPRAETENTPVVAEEGEPPRKDDDMATAKKTKKVEKAKAVKPKSGEKVHRASGPRPKWNGHSMVALARLAGSLKYSYGKTCAILDELGLKHSTVRTNWTYGKKGGKEGCEIPELSPTDLKEFKRIANGITEEMAEKAERKANNASGDTTPKKPRTPKAEKAEKPKVKKTTDGAGNSKKKKKTKAKSPIVDDTEEPSEPDTDDQKDTGIIDDTEDATETESPAELVEA